MEAKKDFRVENIAKPKVRYIVDNLTTKKKTWLDIGCGIGEVLHVASCNGFKVLGIETNKEEREFGIEKFEVEIDGAFGLQQSFWFTKHEAEFIKSKFSDIVINRRRNELGIKEEHPIMECFNCKRDRRRFASRRVF